MASAAAVVVVVFGAADESFYSFFVFSFAATNEAIAD